jgi:hypothetical protein
MTRKEEKSGRFGGAAFKAKFSWKITYPPFSSDGSLIVNDSNTAPER